MLRFGVHKEETTTFDFGDTFLFTGYFDEKLLFNKFEKCYKNDECRFEIQEGDLQEVQQILDIYFYGLVVDDSPGECCIVLEKRPDSRGIPRNSVLRKQRHYHDIYVMKGEISSRQAKKYSATPYKNRKSVRRR